MKFELGGFKTWECAIDLVQYLSQNVDLQNKKVIEVSVFFSLSRPLKLIIKQIFLSQ